MSRWSRSAARQVPRLWLLCLLVGGCAHQAASSPAPGALAPPGAVARSFRLEVVRQNGGVQAFVPARVAGHPSMLLLDTGALRSVLPAEFARAHGLKVRSNAGNLRMQDSNGNVVTTPSLPGVAVQLGEDPHTVQIDFLMTPEGSNGLAVLAPQDLLSKGWALVLDLGGAELRLEPEGAALERVRGAGVPVHEVKFHRCLDEGLFTRAHRVTSAVVNGFRADMLIDTGASSTTLFRNNPAIPSMRSMAGARAASVGVTSQGAALVVDGVPVEFDGLKFVLSALVLPVANRTCWEGLLGADVLQHCSLVWGWGGLWAACRPQAPAGRE